MMQPKWLIQTEIFREDLSDLISAIESSNCQYFILNNLPLATELKTPFDNDEVVITYGSLELVKRVKRTKRWIPGYWCNLEAFRCLSYYAHYGKFLLNKKYSVLPFAEVVRLKSDLYQEYGDPIFIRPDRADKPFAGHDISFKEFESQIGFLKGFCSSDLTVIVSSFKIIEREWRFVVTKDGAVSGSMYIKHGDIISELVESGEAWDYAQKITQLPWTPDLIFTIDVCETKDDLHLLEINSFSCSGLYAADKNKIVQTANRIALEEFADIYK